MPNGAAGEDSRERDAKQKHDRRDARLILELFIEDRFPEILGASTEERDLRTLLRDRHQWVDAGEVGLWEA